MASTESSGPRVHDLVVDAFGVDLHVHLDLREPGADRWEDELRAALPPRSTAREATAAHRFTVHGEGGSAVVEGPDGREVVAWEAAAHALDRSIRALVALEAPGRIFVHAGAVAGPGGALLLPGSSFAGKSTLVAALLTLGATYLSDEYAVLDADGLVHPYPRRVSLRLPAGARRELAAEAIGAPTAPGPCRVVGVADLAYAEGSPAELRTGTSREAALALAEHAVAARTRPGEVLAATVAATREAWFVSGQRGDAAAVAAALLDRLGR